MIVNKIIARKLTTINNNFTSYMKYIKNKFIPMNKFQ